MGYWIGRSDVTLMHGFGDRPIRWCGRSRPVCCYGSCCSRQLFGDSATVNTMDSSALRRLMVFFKGDDEIGIVRKFPYDSSENFRGFAGHAVRGVWPDSTAVRGFGKLAAGRKPKRIFYQWVNNESAFDEPKCICHPVPGQRSVPA